MLPFISLLGFGGLTLAQGGLVLNPKTYQGGGEGNNTIQIDLSSMRNNRAFGMKPGDADIDGSYSAYPAQFMPGAKLSFSGITFDFPQYAEAGNDNVLGQGQTITPPKGKYAAISMLAAAETAIATGTINATYADGSNTSSALLVDPFWGWPYPFGGDVIFPYFYNNESIDYNRSMIYQVTKWIDSTKDLVSFQLPDVSSGAAGSPGGNAENTRLHIYSLSLVPAGGQSYEVELAVQNARTTQNWIEGTNKAQIVEVTVTNVGQKWLLADSGVQVTVSSDGLKTVIPAKINRLRPGDQAIVQVGVENADGYTVGNIADATVNVIGKGVKSSYSFKATCGIVPYQKSYESIYTHESPTWYSDAKYGIFVHWGIYSVPGWGNVGPKENYPAWYWWYMNEGPGMTSGFYEYNLATYGPQHNYDEFIPQFTTSAWDPKEWVDLFADAGAQYFVQVSKHHEGYSLYDLPANITQRTSVALPPHRNLLQELFDAAAKHQPQLHRAAYYSMSEWFNPAYKKYGFGAWPGGNATNPYTNETLEYTGFVEIDDYLSDFQLPSMLELANMGSE